MTIKPDYRHMVGKKRYGALGTMVLPMALLSIGAALYFTGIVVAHGISRISSLFIKMNVVGVSINPTIPTLDPFFINTTLAALIAYTLIALALTLIFIGKHLAQVKLHPASVPLYILAYGFLAPLWIAGALVRATARAQAPWR